jgi:hypothetical protein
MKCKDTHGAPFGVTTFRIGPLELLDSEEVPGDVDTRADEFGLRCAAVPDALWVQHEHGFWSKKIFWR